MLGQFFQNKIEEAGATARLREMVAVLRRREVVRGMTPEKLRMVLEDLGPTFVKLGQVMSMRPDFLPPEEPLPPPVVTIELLLVSFIPYCFFRRSPYSFQ